MQEKQFDDENNKYCRNCGNIITNSIECEKCHTKIVNKRVATDNNYIFLIVLNVILITIGIVIDNGIILLISLLVIIGAKQKYSKIPIVKFLHNIEVTIVILYLLFIIYTFVSCMSSCI